jgi:hypothetical protein
MEQSQKEWGRYNTTPVLTQEKGGGGIKGQPGLIGAAENYFRFTNGTRVKRTQKNTEQQNSKEMVIQIKIIMKV